VVFPLAFATSLTYNTITAETKYPKHWQLRGSLRGRLGIGVLVMPIDILLKNDLALTPEDAKILVQTFEDTLKALGLTDREDPATLLVAKKVIEAAKRGERDPERLRASVLASFSDAAEK
jgi:hypothetical protein